MGSRTKKRKAPGSGPGSALRERVDIAGVADFFSRIASVHPDRERISFVCIGTDRSTGDSFGPWIGTMLRGQEWPSVTGTLETPCDAERYKQAVANIPAANTIIAIDACLGKIDPARRFLVAAGPLIPGCATGRELPPLGHYSLAGIVGPLSVKPYWSLQRASLYEVMGMAGEVAAAIGAAWSLPAVRASIGQQYTGMHANQGKE